MNLAYILILLAIATTNILYKVDQMDMLQIQSIWKGYGVAVATPKSLKLLSPSLNIQTGMMISERITKTKGDWTIFLKINPNCKGNDNRFGFGIFITKDRPDISQTAYQSENDFNRFGMRGYGEGIGFVFFKGFILPTRIKENDFNFIHFQSNSKAKKLYSLQSTMLNVVISMKDESIEFELKEEQSNQTKKVFKIDKVIDLDEFYITLSASSLDSNCFVKYRNISVAIKDVKFKILGTRGQTNLDNFALRKLPVDFANLLLQPDSVLVDKRESENNIVYKSFSDSFYQKQGEFLKTIENISKEEKETIDKMIELIENKSVMVRSIINKYDFSKKSKLIDTKVLTNYISTMDRLIEHFKLITRNLDNILLLPNTNFYLLISWLDKYNKQTEKLIAMYGGLQDKIKLIEQSTLYNIGINSRFTKLNSTHNRFRVKINNILGEMWNEYDGVYQTKIYKLAFQFILILFLGITYLIYKTKRKPYLQANKKAN